MIGQLHKVRDVNQSQQFIVLYKCTYFCETGNIKIKLNLAGASNTHSITVYVL